MGIGARDYRALLVKYMKFLEQQEGFVRLPEFADKFNEYEKFSDEEVYALRNCHIEAISVIDEYEEPAPKLIDRFVNEVY